MLDLFEQRVPRTLTRPFVIRTQSGARMDFDGGCSPRGDQPGLLVEAWAHQGPPKAAQKKKVVADALKLAYGATLLAGHVRLVLLFSDEEAMAPFFSPRAWSAAAFASFGVSGEVVPLPDVERALIRRAQERQYR